MLKLALRNLTLRKGRTLFTILAIALGVSMIFAMRIVGGTAAETGRESREQRLAGGDLEVTSRSVGTPLDTGLVARILAVPGVEAAAPIYRRLEGTPDTSVASNMVNGFPMRGTGLSLLGVDPGNRLIPYALTGGTFFSGPAADEVLLPSTWAAIKGIGIGQRITLVTGDQRRDYRVVGLLKSDQMLGTSVAWIPLATLQQAFDTPGAASAILVKLRDGVPIDQARDDIQRAFGTTITVTSAAGSTGGGNFLGLLIDMALPFSSVAVLLAGSFLVYNAFAITVAERRREISQLRTLGMTRQQVLRQVLAEALLVALLGSLVGILLGYGVGRGMIAVLLGQLQQTRVSRVVVPLDAPFLALGAGVLVTLLVTLNLARRAARVSPLAAMRADVAAEEQRGWYMRRGWIAAAIILAIFAVLYLQTQRLITQSWGDWFFLVYALPFLLAAAALLLLPVVVRLALGLFERLARRSGRGWLRLAAGSLSRSPGRTVLTSASMAIGLMLIIGLSGMMLAFNTLSNSLMGPLFGGDFLLARTTPGSSFADVTASGSPPPLSPALIADLASLNRDAQVFFMTNIHLPEYPSSPGMDNGLGVTFAMLEGRSGYHIVEGSWAELRSAAARGPAIILSPPIAQLTGLHVGDTIPIDTFEGRVNFTVAMIGGALPMVDTATAQRYFHASPGVITITARSPDGHAALGQRVQAISRQHGLIFTAEPQKLFSDTLADITNIVVMLFAALTSLSGLIAGLAIANTQVASIMERQREIGALRALGMDRRQVRRMVVAEAGVIGLTGAVVGVITGLAMVVAFGYLIDTITRTITGSATSDGIAIPWTTSLAALIFGPAMAMLAALYPGARAANVNPADAMRAEGSTGFKAAAAQLGPTGLRGFFARMPLAIKLSLSISMVLVLTISTLTAVQVRYERQLLEENLLRIAQAGLDMMGDAAREQIPANITELNEDTLDELMFSAQQQPEVAKAQFQNGATPYQFGVRYFMILDPDGRVIRSDRGELTGRVLTAVPLPQGAQAQVRRADWSGERVFEAIAPLETRGGRRLGYMVMGMATDAVDQISADIIRASLVIMLVALGVTLALTALLTRRTLTPLAMLVDLTQSVTRGDLSRRIPEDRWDELGRLARAFNTMVKGLSERERMRDLFGRYLSREVSEAVLAGAVRLGGERKEVSVIFADMRGSTRFAEGQAPEEVMLALNQYFEIIITATEANGGILGRFLGDGALCIFGAPRALADHADCAVRATLAMRAGLIELNHWRAGRGLPILHFGIGINTGAVTAGATGSEQRQEYTIIGDAVNLAARIEEQTKQHPDYDILLSEFTHRALGPRAQRYRCAELGSVAIRGRSQSVIIFGLLGEVAAAAPQPSAISAEE